jgi:hypothetical protein
MIAGWVIRNKLLLGFILLVAVLSAFVIYGMMSHPAWWCNYNKSITRNADTPEEENALLTAETIDYTGILSVDRFEGSGGFRDWVWANFIDAEVVKNYAELIDNLKPGEYRSASLTYNADVHAVDNIHAVCAPYPENPEYVVDISRVQLLSANGSVLDEYGASTRYAYGNTSGIHEAQASTVDYRFSDCYVVEMRLSLELIEPSGDGVGFTAFYQSDIRQTVILDGNLAPLLVCVNETHFP